MENVRNEIIFYAKPQTSPRLGFLESKKIFSEIFNKLSYPDDVDSDLSAIHPLCSQAVILTNTLSSDLKWLSDLPLSIYLNEEAKLRKVGLAIDEIGLQIKEQDDLLLSIGAEIGWIDNEILSLTEIKPYFDHGYAADIGGLDAKVAEIRLVLSKISSATYDYKLIRNSILNRDDS